MLSFARALSLATLLMLSPALFAQVDDSFDAFMEEANADFDAFLEEEEKSFADFLRDPWREFESEQPVELPPRPEPPSPVVYDAADERPDDKPASLVIGEIFKLNRVSDGEGPTVKVIDAAHLDFGDEPRRKGGTVTIVRDTVWIDLPAAVQPPVPSDGQPAPDVAPTEPADAQPQTPVDQPRQPDAVPSEPAATPQRPDDAAPSGNVTADEPAAARPADNVQPSAPATPSAAAPSTSFAPQLPAVLLKSGAGKIKVTFGGCDLWMTDAFSGAISMTGTGEKDVADAYDALSRTNYRRVLNECAAVREGMSLNGWGYNLLVEALAERSLNGADARTMLRFFLLAESGMDVRIGRKATTGRLMLFVAPDCELFGYPYSVIDGKNYYNVSDRDVSAFYTYTAQPSTVKALGMGLATPPRFAGGFVTSSHKAAKSGVTVRASVPSSLAQFYKDYPQCDYAVYLSASVDSRLRQSLVNALAPAINGKSEADAANLLINFVQTAFDYKTDDQQFGIEKPFFVEEMFVYPYSDCEDRAIFFSYLVRELMGLDVVLLNYPGHMATAVAFHSDVKGDNIMVGGRRYTVCDPTYIGAPIGRAMPQFRNVAADVILMD